VKNGPQYPAYFQAKYKPNKDPLILACRSDQNNNVSTCINSLLVRFFVAKPGHVLVEAQEQDRGGDRRFRQGFAV
jgi:hypothetical protein